MPPDWRNCLAHTASTRIRVPVKGITSGRLRDREAVSSTPTWGLRSFYDDGGVCLPGVDGEVCRGKGVMGLVIFFPSSLPFWKGSDVSFP